MNVGDWLFCCDIGGLGETSVKAVRFQTYALEFNKGYSPLLEAECVIDEMPKKLKNHSLTGLKILISLYNLYEEIKAHDDQDDVMTAKLVAKWCQKHVHPYHFSEIYSLIPLLKDYAELEEDEGSKRDLTDPMERLLRAQEQSGNIEQPVALPLSKRGWYEKKSKAIADLAVVNLYEFMDDLRRLYERAKTYNGIADARNGDFTLIRTIANNTLNFSSVWNDIAREIVAEGKVTDTALEKFADSLPEIPLKTAYSSEKEFVYVAPKLNSVFDVANYALILLVASNAPNLEDSQSKQVITFCAACGKMFAKTGPRQKYCETFECQRVRFARNAAAYRARKKRGD